MANREQAQGRRQFLRRVAAVGGAATVAAAGGAAVAGAGREESRTTAATPAPAPQAAQGYRETPHIREYYRLARM